MKIILISGLEGHHCGDQVFMDRAKCWACPRNDGLGMPKRATTVDTLKISLSINFSNKHICPVGTLR